MNKLREINRKVVKHNLLNRVIQNCFAIMIALIILDKSYFLFQLLPTSIALLGIVGIIVLLVCICNFWEKIYNLSSTIFEWLNKKTTTKTAIVYIILLSFSLKIVSILVLQINSLIHPDIDVYVTTASELVKMGRAHTFGEYCMNYSHMFWFAFFLTPVVRIFGKNYIALSIYMALVGTTSMVVLFDTVRRNFSKKRALAAFTIFSLFPSQILLPSFITHEQAMLFFLSLSIWFLFGLLPPIYSKNRKMLSVVISGIGILLLAIAIQINLAGSVAAIALCIVLFVKFIDKPSLKKWIFNILKCIIIVLIIALIGNLCRIFQENHSDYNRENNHNYNRKIIWTLFVGSNVKTSGQWSIEDMEIFDNYPEGATIEEQSRYQTNLLFERYEKLFDNYSIIKLVREKWTTIWSYFNYPINYANETISDSALRGVYNRYLFKPLTCIEYGISIILVLFCLRSVFSKKHNSKNIFFLFVQLYLLGTTVLFMLTECTNKYTISMQPFILIACIAMCGARKANVLKDKNVRV